MWNTPSSQIIPGNLSYQLNTLEQAGSSKATQTLVVNSNDVLLDDLWLWRADHGTGVGWTTNTETNGLIVNGNHVTAYGLFVEHYQQYQVIWNGKGGSLLRRLLLSFRSHLAYSLMEEKTSR